MSCGKFKGRIFFVSLEAESAVTKKWWHLDENSIRTLTCKNNDPQFLDTYPQKPQKNQQRKFKIH